VDRGTWDMGHGTMPQPVPCETAHFSGLPSSAEDPEIGPWSPGALEWSRVYSAQWNVVVGPRIPPSWSKSTQLFHATGDATMPQCDNFEAEQSSPGVRSLVRPASLVLIHVLGMNHTQMSCQCIVSAERLLLGAQRTVHLLLPGIVDGVLVPGQIVRSREDGVARLARRWVDSLALCQVSIRFHFR
jgi:hypothetical protein